MQSAAMSLRLAVALLCSIFYFAGPQVGLLVGASATEQQLSIEELETRSQFENFKGTLEGLGVQVERMGRTFELKCLSAFGHTAFCHCLKENRPVATPFENYILAVTQTKDELGFNKLKKEDQQIVLRLRQTRDQCVKTIQ